MGWWSARRRLARAVEVERPEMSSRMDRRASPTGPQINSRDEWSRELWPMSIGCWDQGPSGALGVQSPAVLGPSRVPHFAPGADSDLRRRRKRDI